MTIAFVTTQTITGSTVVGRVLPLAEEFTKRHQVYILVHKAVDSNTSLSLYRERAGVRVKYIGRNPFIKTPGGKTRLSGFRLVWCMLFNSLRTFFALKKIKPDVVIIVKPLPQNVLAVRLYKTLPRTPRGAGVILDVDDFELTANKLTSLTQRAAIHWSQRTGAKLADHIVTATPFLTDHFKQLTQSKKKITMIPTGVTSPPTPLLTKERGDHHAVPSPYQGEDVPPAGGASEVYLLYLGSISISSGHRVDLLPDILQAVSKKFPNTQLHLAGDGDDINKIKTLFKRLDLAKQVHWHGRFGSHDIPILLSQTDILIDPIDSSITNRAKSSSRVALAMAYGLPIVTSDVGLRPELIPHHLHDRCFAQPADANSYADKIINLLHHPLDSTDRQTMHKHSQLYTWPALAKRYNKIINLNP